MKTTNQKIQTLSDGKVWDVVADEKDHLYIEWMHGFWVPLGDSRIGDFSYVYEKSDVPPQQMEIAKVAGKPPEVVEKEIEFLDRKEKTAITEDVMDPIDRGVDVAKRLAEVIRKTNLSVKIRDHEYVNVEGWEMLGVLMSVRARVLSVRKTESGYEAYAEVINQKGEQVSTGMMLCRADEEGTTKQGKKYKKWNDEYAVMSMAQTRAIGKAYRMGFAWVMALAGYAGTPAEEVEND